MVSLIERASDGKYYCPVCRRCFGSRSNNLEQHINTVHLRIKRWQCRKHCRERFFYSGQRKQHELKCMLANKREVEYIAEGSRGSQEVARRDDSEDTLQIYTSASGFVLDGNVSPLIVGAIPQPDFIAGPDAHETNALLQVHGWDEQELGNLEHQVLDDPIPFPQELGNAGHQVLDEHAPLPQERGSLEHLVLGDPVSLLQELRNVGQRQVSDDPGVFWGSLQEERPYKSPY